MRRAACRRRELHGAAQLNHIVSFLLGRVSAAEARGRHHMSPFSSLLEGHARKCEGGFRVLSQQSESADNRPNTAGQNGAIVNQAARRSNAGERSAGETLGAETSATRDKATSGARKHCLDYATAFLTLAAAGGAITAAVFTGWQATTADQGLRASNRAYVHSTNFRFIHYGAKNASGRTQWSISPLIDNTGNTGTRGMLMHSIISSAGDADFDSLEKRPSLRRSFCRSPS